MDRKTKQYLIAVFLFIGVLLLCWLGPTAYKSIRNGGALAGNQTLSSSSGSPSSGSPGAGASPGADVEQLLGRVRKTHIVLDNIDASCCWVIASLKLLRVLVRDVAIPLADTNCGPPSSKYAYSKYFATERASTSLIISENRRRELTRTANRCLREIRSPVQTYFQLANIYDSYMAFLEVDVMKKNKDVGGKYKRILKVGMFLSELIYAAKNQEEVLDTLRTFKDDIQLLNDIDRILKNPKGSSYYRFNLDVLRDDSLKLGDLNGRFMDFFKVLVAPFTTIFDALVDGYEGALVAPPIDLKMGDATRAKLTQSITNLVLNYFSKFRLNSDRFNQGIADSNPFAMRLAGKRPNDNFCGDSKEFLANFINRIVGVRDGLPYEIKGVRLNESGSGSVSDFLCSQPVAVQGTTEVRTYPVLYLDLEIRDFLELAKPTVSAHISRISAMFPQIRFTDTIVIFIHNYLPSNDLDAMGRLSAKPGFRLVRDNVQGSGSYTFVDVAVEEKLEIANPGEQVPTTYWLQSFNVDRSNGQYGHVVNVTSISVSGHLVFFELDGGIVNEIPDLNRYFATNGRHISSVVYGRNPLASI